MKHLRRAVNRTALRRRGGIFSSILITLSLTSTFPGAAEASCYSSGYGPFCDGIGAPSADIQIIEMQQS